MLFLEYSPTGDIKDGDIRLVLLNDKKRNRLLIFCYIKNSKTKYYEYLGEIRIYGYYPKQIRKILYNVQKKIRENTDGYRDKIIEKPVTISRGRAFAFKRWIEYGGGKTNK